MFVRWNGGLEQLTAALVQVSTHWVVIDALEEHWRRARVEADLRPRANSVQLTTTNVAALTLAIPPGLCPFDPTRPTEVEIDGQRLEASRSQSDRSWQVRFSKAEKKWRLASARLKMTESRASVTVCRGLSMMPD